MVPTLLGITLITFIVISIAPGDPVQSTFGTGGPGATEAEGGGSNQVNDRLADAIKAKKQLLGMMAPDHSLLGWGAGQAGAAGPGVVWPDVEAGFDTWARRIVHADNLVYVGLKSGEVVGLDATNRRETARFQAHAGSIWGLAAAGGYVASSDKTGTITVHSSDGTVVVEVEGDGRPVRDLAFAGGGLVAASDTGAVRLIDPTTGTVTREMTAHTAGVYALEPLPGNRLVTGGVDRRVILWDLATGEIISEEEDSHRGAITDLEASADGRWLASASDDRAARVFEVRDDELKLISTAEGHHKAVTAVALSDDGDLLFTGSVDETVRSWEAASGTPRGLAGESTGKVLDMVVVQDTALSAGEFWRKVPVWSQYFTWTLKLAKLDFGRSFVDDELVLDKMAKALPITIGLNLLAIFIIYTVSLPLGIFAAVRRAKTFDNVSSLVLFVLYSVPNFWLATLLIMFFSSARNFDWFPSGGLHSSDPWSMSFWPWLFDLGWHLVLPVTVMVYAGFASLSRYVRTSMLESLSQDFVRTARAKGLHETVVVLKHAFRNALVTIVTLIGNLLPRLFGGSVIVEYIFSIEGMGKLSFDAILSRDYPVIMAITTIAAVLTLFGILVSDLLYGVVDPRVRVNE